MTYSIETTKPRSSWIVGLALVLMLLSYSSFVIIGDSTGIYGIVRDIDGNPLSDVVVTVSDTSGSFVAKTQTALGGDFLISLDRGTYRVQLEKKGYESKSITCNIPKAYVLVDMGVIALDYGLKLSITQTYLKVRCLSEITIPMTITNKGSEDEAVKISVDYPNGWDVGIFSGIAEIKQLTLSPNEVQSLNLEVWIPYDSSGLYNLTIRASGSTIQESNVSVYVDKVDPGILSSKYPIARVAPGSTVTFDLTIKNVLTKTFSGIISLELPTNWTGTVAREDGSDLYGLSLGPGESVKATLKLEVPGTVSAGDYESKVLVRSQDLESSLSLRVTVATGTAKLKLRTDTPYIDAYAGRTANYVINVQNIGDSDGIVSIDLKGLPVGYTWTIKDTSGSVISKVYLKASESKQLSISVSVPPLAEPDIKSFVLEANVSGTIDRLNLGLGILGWYSMEFVTQNFYVESSAGTSTTFQIAVKNTGYSSLTNVIEQVSDIPDKFTVKVEPNVVLLLKPQETATFTLTITTDADISAGDYYMSLNLKTDQYDVSARNLHVYVKQRGEVVYIGAAIVIIVVGALFLIYRRYGRR